MAASSPRANKVHPRAKVTASAVRAWRREAARTVRDRLKVTGGVNARTGAPLASLLRGTGLFARLAREHEVSVAAVCMAVYGDTWAHLPNALPRYEPPPPPKPAKRAAKRARGAAVGRRSAARSTPV